jgi:hypothetical protein
VNTGREYSLPVCEYCFVIRLEARSKTATDATCDRYRMFATLVAEIVVEAGTL